LKSFLDSVSSFLRFIRWPNLIIIILTQVLVRIAIIGPVYSQAGIQPALSNFLFILLVIVTVVTAAAGYIINDYFDVETDKVNKPESLFVSGFFSEKMVFRLYYFLNGFAIVAGFYLSWMVGAWRLGMIFPMIILLLWLYSERYKKLLLAGNLVVAFLSAIVPVIVWLFEFFALRLQAGNFMMVYTSLHLITKVVLVFTCFAFLLSLVREIVKDAEDAEGDLKAACQTLPLVYGMAVTRRLAVLLLVLTMVLIGFFSWSLFEFQLTIPSLYFILAVGVPLVFIAFKVLKSESKADFHFVSLLMKLVMLIGILGMIPLAICL